METRVIMFKRYDGEGQRPEHHICKNNPYWAAVCKPCIRKWEAKQALKINDGGTK